MPTDLEAGWGWPANSRKPHYFARNEMISLCGRWMYVGERTKPTPGTVTKDDCAACTKKLQPRWQAAADMLTLELVAHDGTVLEADKTRYGTIARLKQAAREKNAQR